MCCREANREYYYSNPKRRFRGKDSQVKKYQSEYYQKNKKSLRKKQKIYKASTIERHRAYQRQWQEENKEHVAEYKREWWAKNKDIATPKRREKDRERFKNNPRIRLYSAFSHLIRQSLRNKTNNKKGRSWESLVGYTIFDLKKHLEKQFTPGMSWENYGKWHVDHKIPVSVFNFTHPEHPDFKRCWELKNLQPLWAKENLKKGAKLEKHFQPRLALGMPC